MERALAYARRQAPVTDDNLVMLALVAEIDRLRASARADNPDFDGTDAAHPAYWRGEDTAVAACAKQILRLCSEPKAGAANPPWEPARVAVDNLRQERDRLARENELLRTENAALRLNLRP